MKSSFARFGIPNCVISDNGPQFSSQEFAQFSRDWEFDHITSSPLYPKANELAERMVRTVKGVLNKCQDPFLALLELRNMPHRSLKESPAQLLMGRKLRSKLPVTEQQLRPSTIDHEAVLNKLQEQQQRTASYYNRNAYPLPPFKSGDYVRVERKGKWEPGIVISQAKTPRSYFVQTENGKYRRNRINLRPSNRSYTPSLQIFDEELNHQPVETTTNRQQQPRTVAHQPPAPLEPARRSARTIRKPLRYRTESDY